MKREHRQPTKAELERITSKRPVVRRIRPEEFWRIVEGTVGRATNASDEKRGRTCKG